MRNLLEFPELWTGDFIVPAIGESVTVTPDVTTPQVTYAIQCDEGELHDGVCFDITNTGPAKIRLRMSLPFDSRGYSLITGTGYESHVAEITINSGQTKRIDTGQIVKFLRPELEGKCGLQIRIEGHGSASFTPVRAPMRPVRTLIPLKTTEWTERGLPVPSWWHDSVFVGGKFYSDTGSTMIDLIPPGANLSDDFVYFNHLTIDKFHWSTGGVINTEFRNSDESLPEEDQRLKNFGFLDRNLYGNGGLKLYVFMSGSSGKLGHFFLSNRFANPATDEDGNYIARDSKGINLYHTPILKAQLTNRFTYWTDEGFRYYYQSGSVRDFESYTLVAGTGLMNDSVFDSSAFYQVEIFNDGPHQIQYRVYCICRKADGSLSTNMITNRPGNRELRVEVPPGESRIMTVTRETLQDNWAYEVDLFKINGIHLDNAIGTPASSVPVIVRVVPNGEGYYRNNLLAEPTTLRDHLGQRVPSGWNEAEKQYELTGTIDPKIEFKSEFLSKQVVPESGFFGYVTNLNEVPVQINCPLIRSNGTVEPGELDGTIIEPGERLAFTQNFEHDESNQPLVPQYWAMQFQTPSEVADPQEWNMLIELDVEEEEEPEEAWVYVTSPSTNAVYRFDTSGATPEGVLVAGGNGSGTGPNQLQNPHAVLVDRVTGINDGDPRHKLYITNWNAGTVAEWYEGESSKVKSTKVGHQTSLITRHGDQLYTAEETYLSRNFPANPALLSNRILTYPQLVPVAGDGYYPTTTERLRTSFNAPRSMVIDDQGRMFVFDRPNGSGSARITRRNSPWDQGDTFATVFPNLSGGQPMQIAHHAGFIYYNNGSSIVRKAVDAEAWESEEVLVSGYRPIGLSVQEEGGDVVLYFTFEYEGLYRKVVGSEDQPTLIGKLPGSGTHSGIFVLKGTAPVYEEEVPEEVEPYNANFFANPELFSSEWRVSAESVWNASSKRYEIISSNGQAGLNFPSTVDNFVFDPARVPEGAYLRARVRNLSPTPLRGYIDGQNVYIPQGHWVIVEDTGWPQYYSEMWSPGSGYDVDFLIETEWDESEELPPPPTFDPNFLRNINLQEHWDQSIRNGFRAGWDEASKSYDIIYHDRVSTTFNQNLFNMNGYVMPEGAFVKCRITNRSPDGLTVSAYQANDSGEWSERFLLKVMEPDEILILESQGWQHFQLDLESSMRQGGYGVDLLIETEWEEEGPSEFDPNLICNPTLFLGSDNQPQLLPFWNEETREYEVVGAAIAVQFDLSDFTRNHTLPEDPIIRARVTNRSSEIAIFTLHRQDDIGHGGAIFERQVMPGFRWSLSQDEWTSVDLSLLPQLQQNTALADVLIETNWEREQLTAGNLMQHPQLLIGDSYGSAARGYPLLPSWHEETHRYNINGPSFTASFDATQCDDSYLRPQGSHVRFRITNENTERLRVIITTRSSTGNVAETVFNDFISRAGRRVFEFPTWDRFSIRLESEYGAYATVTALIETQWEDGDEEFDPNLMANPQLLTNVDWWDTSEAFPLLSAWDPTTGSYDVLRAQLDVEFDKEEFSYHYQYPEGAHVRFRVTNREIETMYIRTQTDGTGDGDDAVYQYASLGFNQKAVFNIDRWEGFGLQISSSGGPSYGGMLDMLIETQWETEYLNPNLFLNPQVVDSYSVEFNAENNSYRLRSGYEYDSFYAYWKQAVMSGMELPEGRFVRARITNLSETEILHVFPYHMEEGDDPIVLHPLRHTVIEHPEWNGREANSSSYSIGLESANPRDWEEDVIQIDALLETEWEDEEEPVLVPVPNLLANPQLFQEAEALSNWNGSNYEIMRSSDSPFEMTFQSDNLPVEIDEVPANAITRARVLNLASDAIIVNYFREIDGESTTSEDYILQEGESMVFNYEGWGNAFTLSISTDGSPIEPPVAPMSLVGPGNFHFLIEPDWVPDGGGGDDPIVEDETYRFKGFVSLGEMTYNEPHAVAPLGELSNRSRTYSRDQQHYARGTNRLAETAVTLTAFSSRDLVSGTHAEAPVAFQQFLLDLGHWSYQQAEQGVFTQDADSYRLAALERFPSVLSHLQVGRMVHDEARNLWLPESITFYLHASAMDASWTEEDLSRLRISKMRLWFSDAAFLNQYDEYEITCIGPTDHLEDFFRTPTRVRELVNQRTLSEHHALIALRAGKSPYTVVKSEQFTYHAPNSQVTFPTNWTFVVWGNVGNNYDILKHELATWILEHSNRTREHWAQILPEIFTSTEFVLAPLWTSYAIPNKTIDPGMYSPTVPMAYAQQVADRMSAGVKYTHAHVRNSTAVLNTTYKSLAILAIGGPENGGRRAQFMEVFRDYMAIPTRDPDFDRMSMETRGWVEFLYRLLFVAEGYNESLVLPEDMWVTRRRNRQDETITYISGRYRNIQYLVVTKPTMNLMFPPAGQEPLSLTANGVEGQTRLPHMSGLEYAITFIAQGGVAPYTYALVEDSESYWAPLEELRIDPVTGEFTAYRSTGSDGDLIIPIRVVDQDNREVTVNFELHVVGY